MAARARVPVIVLSSALAGALAAGPAASAGEVACPAPVVRLADPWRGDLGAIPVAVEETLQVDGRAVSGRFRSQPVARLDRVRIAPACAGRSCRACVVEVAGEIGFRAVGIRYAAALARRRDARCVLGVVRAHERLHARVAQMLSARWPARAAARIRADLAGPGAVVDRAGVAGEARRLQDRVRRSFVAGIAAMRAWADRAHAAVDGPARRAREAEVLKRCREGLRGD